MCRRASIIAAAAAVLLGGCSSATADAVNLVAELCYGGSGQLAVMDLDRHESTNRGPAVSWQERLESVDLMAASYATGAQLSGQAAGLDGDWDRLNLAMAETTSSLDTLSTLRAFADDNARAAARWESIAVEIRGAITVVEAECRTVQRPQRAT